MMMMKILAMATYLLVGSSALIVKDETTETISSSSSSKTRGYATRQIDIIPDAQVVTTATTTGGGQSIGSAYLEALENSIKEVEKTKKEVVEGQKLTYSGNISLQAAKGQVQALADKIKALVKEDSRGSLTNENLYNEGGDFIYAEEYPGMDGRPDNKNNRRMVLDMSLRVANKHFHDVVASIKALVDPDMVQSSYINSEDLTDSYLTATARDETRDVTRNALKVLLVKADNVKDVLSIHAELNNNGACPRQEFYDPYSGMGLDSIKRRLEYSDLSVSVREKRDGDFQTTERIEPVSAVRIDNTGLRDEPDGAVEREAGEILN